ncbi:uncharacterized protein LOC120118848 [Hibiscus syriacus]|uniref:uncharacterized protein LOC120118848 n=1 Tax=Hibiscus syriacus TaxID=106335 RepID=UPI0019244A79|nr:uncharacterized protein LOC120118848 [Hibiscus syriacus]
MATSQLPPKLKDTWSFTIPCNIGDTFVEKALFNLGYSINLMPLSIFTKFESGEARPTTVTLQLADRSIVHPSGIVENMCVQIDKFIFPTEFIILYCEVDKKYPIILGRPFIVIGRALIDVEKGELTMRLNDEHIIFNVLNNVSYLSNIADYFSLDVNDIFAQEHLEKCYNTEEPIDDIIAIEETTNNECCSNYLQKYESLAMPKCVPSAPKPSVEEPPKLELKPLPDYLEYAYLGDNETLSFIVAMQLTVAQKEQLIDVLQQHKKAITWGIADIKLISLSLCMHKILLEDSASSLIKLQGRLNLIMKEVVRKEIIKWLDARIIYPILDNKWVSPVQCVSKKGDITVVTNEKNELVSTTTMDKAKVEVIDKLPPPTTVKAVRSFLGHAIFYRKFIKDFSQMSKPLCSLMEQNRKFVLDAEVLNSFETIKKKLVNAPVIIALDWKLSFELMSDASDFAVGAVLGQHKDKMFHSIHYVSRMLNNAQSNYTTTEKELLDVVFAFDKFHSYLVGTKVIVYTDHSALKHLFVKKIQSFG